MKESSQRNGKSSNGTTDRNGKQRPQQRQRKSPSPQTSSSKASSYMRTSPSSRQHRAQRKPTNPPSLHIRSSHVIFAVCILASAMVPIYVFDSPEEFLGIVNAFFFPPILSNSNSMTKSSNSKQTKNDNESKKREELVSGGWRLPEPEVLDKYYDRHVCNIERISVVDLTLEIFESRVRFKKPVLVTFPNGAAGWTDPVKWTKSSLVREYSQWAVQSGTSLEIVRRGGNGEQSSSFLQFINGLQSNATSAGGQGSYMFDRAFYFHSELPKTLKLPKYFSIEESKDESIFFLGASLSGVVFHKHSDTWNGVVFGKKRWFLYPSTRTPPGGVYNGFSILEWLSRVYPNLTDSDKPIECVQEPGEILYLPEGTYHATLNLGDTVAFAIQKKLAVLRTEVLSYQATDLVNKIQGDAESPANKKVHTKFLMIFTELNRLLPESTEVMLKLGEALYNLQEFTDAMNWYQAALQRDPYFVIAYIHMGKTLSKLRKYEKAEASFKKAAEMSPDLWDVYKEYGEFLLRQGRFEDALPVFKKGTQLMPGLLPFWFYYNQCQIRLGDMEGADTSEQIMKQLKATSEM